MPILKAGRYDIDYSEAGAGPTVLLLHSSAAGNRQWRKLMEELAVRYRLVAVNLFGYGATSKWPDKQPLTLADGTELVVAASALTAGPVSLVGHSLGAAVALEAAVHLGPRLRCLVAFEPILFYLLKDNGENEAFAEIEAMRRNFVEYGAKRKWNAAANVFVDYWSGEGTWAAMPNERKAGILTTLPFVMREWDMMGDAGRPVGDWNGITAPVHILHAADTRLPTGTVTTLLARANPAWHLHEIEAGGHMAPITRPDLVNPQIAEILDATR